MSSSKKEKKSKRKHKEESSSEDSGPEDREPVKKMKTEAGDVKVTVNDQGEEMMEIGPKRFVTVRQFKGSTYIDIREFFDDKKTGKLSPGKKGISLSKGQYEAFKQLMGEIDKKIA